MVGNKILFVVVVLAFGTIQQLGRPRSCTICRLNNPAFTQPFPRNETTTHLIAVSPVITVQNDSELRIALSRLQAGSTLKIAPGEYRGGHHVQSISGLVVEAVDPQQPPVFVAGGNAWHFSTCSDLTVRNLVFRGQTGNGINVDDGGRMEPTENVRLEKLRIEDVGPKGNHDAIKLSGIDHFAISECQLNGWGGQGIDMVGCHHGTIQKCLLKGKAGFTASAGIQTKGGTSDVVIEECEFMDAGERPLNLGGSTGLDFFRPADASYEAARITARRNRIEGGMCSVAFVGVDGAEFSDNTLLYPTKWVFRILQETKGERFAACRRVKIHGNRIAFRRADVQIECNIGDGTQLASFEFRQNVWFAADRPDRSQPRLPVPEVDGTYGQDWARTKKD